MHHYDCVAPDVDINLQSGRFWVKSIASFRERLNDSRSRWIVFIRVVRGRPGGLLQFSIAGKKLLRSSLHLFRLSDAQCGRTGSESCKLSRPVKIRRVRMNNGGGRWVGEWGGSERCKIWRPVKNRRVRMNNAWLAGCVLIARGSPRRLRIRLKQSTDRYLVTNGAICAAPPGDGAMN